MQGKVRASWGTLGTGGDVSRAMLSASTHLQDQYSLKKYTIMQSYTLSYATGVAGLLKCIVSLTAHLADSLH